MKLNVIRHEGPDGPPLVVAHGLFGSARNWGAVAKRLSAGRTVLAVDLRNHGESPWAEEHSYAALAEDLAGVVAEAGGRADLLGHSMGGKAAMTLALSEPSLVRRLVVADIAPVRYGHSQMVYVEAMESLDLEGVTRRSEADRRLAEAVPDRGVRAFLLQSLVLGEGRATWRLNLAALRAEMDRIMGFPDFGQRQFEGPVLAVRGGGSDYVRDEHLAGFRALFPAVRVATIEGAGHWLHAEAPEPFVAEVAAFLDA